MSVRRVYQKTSRTPEQQGELQAIREKYQSEKPSLEQALAESGDAAALPLGDVILIHAIMTAIKRERERIGMTLAQVEAATEIDQATLSKLESGKHGNPTVSTLSRICGAIGKRICCTLQDIEPVGTR